MSVNLLINGAAGAGKTVLLSSLDERSFVVSRDGKEFSLSLPHMLVETYTDMNNFINGEDGIVNKMELYHKKFSKYPDDVIIDSGSQVFMDVIDVASQKPNNYGSQGAEITKEMAIFNKFIHEDLQLNGINTIILNHVIEEKEEGKSTGKYVSFGQGKFLQKGSFYSTTNESILIGVEGNHRAIYTRDDNKLARTFCNNVPDKMWVENIVNPSKSKTLKEGEEYFNLRKHLDMLIKSQVDNSKWSF